MSNFCRLKFPCLSVPSVGVISPSFTLYTLHLTPLSVPSVGDISIRRFQKSTSSHMQELRYHSSERILWFIVDIGLQQFCALSLWNNVVICDGSGNKARESFAQFHFILCAAYAYGACALHACGDHERIVAYHVSVHRMLQRYDTHAKMLCIKTSICGVNGILIGVSILFVSLCAPVRHCPLSSSACRCFSWCSQMS